MTRYPLPDKLVCYTLDLEEDHAGYIQDFFEGLDKLEKLINFISEKKIYVSFFVQGKVIEKYPEKIELIRNNNFEIHIHSYSHEIQKYLFNISVEEDLQKSFQIYQDFFGIKPIGNRFPLGLVNKHYFFLLKKYGIKFDSSIFPTFRPGYFNYIGAPIYPFKINQIIEFPFSVISQIVRIPISLSYLKLLYPLHFIPRYTISPIIFDFHLHDLFHLKSSSKLGKIREIPYLRFRDRGLDLFLKFHNKLLRDGYKTIGLSKLYNLVR